MNKLTAAMLISLLIIGVCGVISGYREVDGMTDKIIRIHVIANSDSDEDQELKYKVRDGILKTASEIISGCESKEEAMQRISENLYAVESAARRVLDENGSQYGVVCSLANEEFDTREYDGFTLPAGDYDSLCVRIGEAKGKNWWCICYPSLCIGTAVSIDDCEVFNEGELLIVKEPQKVRLKLWCYEFLRKLGKIFE